MDWSDLYKPSMERCIGFQKMQSDAVIPKRGSAGAVGYDISSVEDTVIPAMAHRAVSTAIRVKIPDGHYIRVSPRSGLAVKKGIDVLAGVVDPDYTGEVKVILMNHGEESFEIKKGDRIAQLILERCSTPLVIEIPMDADIGQTARGENGFGSTGVSA